MRWLTPKDISLALSVTAAFVLAATSGGGCGSVDDVHDTDEARSKACVDCHRSAYLATTTPKHMGLFGETCGECHTTSAWIPTKNDFHQTPAILSMTCVSCHKPAYDATSRPPHAPVYPDDCKDCHTTKSWVPLARHAHESETAKVTTCSACHIAKYKAATNPVHDGIFPTQCGGCHGQASWRPAVNLSHDWFPLRNRHATLACTDCHKNGFAPGANPNTCVGCHKKDYDAATSPSHAGYSTDCAKCHSDAGWRPFFHGWLLTGKHATTPCTSCHKGNPPVYAGTTTDCVGCHLAAYNSSPYPGHSGFSKVCSDCHSTTAWKPAQGGTHPEASFPIATGKHHSATIKCTDCHNPALGAPQGGKNTDCVGCHNGVHARTSMDAKHSGVKNYPRGAAAPNFCLTCHPSGRKD